MGIRETRMMAAAFPRLPYRGLIEAGSHGAMAERNHDFRDFHIAASLKHKIDFMVPPSLAQFPRLPYRGLIEAFSIWNTNTNAC